MGFAACIGAGAHAAQLDGVPIPGQIQAAGKDLLLNGYGLRTYSWLNIHIYVVALYLEQRSTDASVILRSPETRLLTVRFEHDVTADAAQNAWRVGLANNCAPPSCELDQNEVAKFLASVPAMRPGDEFTLLFSHGQASVGVGGRLLGVVTDPKLSEAMLATFLGPRPASPELKQALLAGHE
jgi:hypothetical protein